MAEQQKYSDRICNSNRKYSDRICTEVEKQSSSGGRGSIEGTKVAGDR